MAIIENTVKYYAFTHNLDYSEHNNFQEAFATNHKFLIRYNIVFKDDKSSNGYVYRNNASTLKFIGAEEETIDFITENGWTLTFFRFATDRRGYSYTHMCMKFTDKIGYSNSEEKFDISLNGFINAYKRFIDLQAYDGYRYANVAIENIDLKEKLTMCEQKNIALEQEMSRLKTLFSAMS